MDLHVRDVAKLLQLSEETLCQWVDEGKIPCYKLNDEYRFSLEEIEGWMIARGQSAQEVSSLLHQGGTQQFSLFRAIHHGGVVSLKASDKTEAIIQGAHLAAKKLALDPEVLADLLLDRENMMSTALSHGVAVPHTRDFVLAHSTTDMILVAYLENPIPFGALDGKPVHTLFFLFSSEDKRHLNLLAKLAHFSSYPEMLAILESRPPEQKLLEIIRNWESSLKTPSHSSVS